MDRVKGILTKKKTILGYRVSDLLGIAIMIIPFIISVTFEKWNPIKFLFIYTGKHTKTSIQPGMISMLCSVVFYASLIVRHEGIFKAENLLDAIISTVRAFLNCWVLAALVVTVFQGDAKAAANSDVLKVFFSNPASTFLLFAILLSWLGMKSIAGYSWILFIAAAWKNLLEIDQAMGMRGAVFILTVAISLFLQIRDHSEIGEFAREFRDGVSKHGDNIRDEINAAKSATEDVAEKTVRAATGVNVSFHSEGRPGGARLDLDALDVNKDGVVDEKDFELLYKGMEREKE